VNNFFLLASSDMVLSKPTATGAHHPLEEEAPYDSIFRMNTNSVDDVRFQPR
jgi:hypothetical protein